MAGCVFVSCPKKDCVNTLPIFSAYSPFGKLCHLIVKNLGNIFCLLHIFEIMLLYSGVVNGHCQLDWIWGHLGITPLRVSFSGISGKFNREGNVHPEGGWYHPLGWNPRPGLKEERNKACWPPAAISTFWLNTQCDQQTYTHFPTPSQTWWTVSL